jgi:glyoxylase-like metal-dependent hydrolase (beta-lactamase superfamily II)
MPAMSITNPVVTPFYDPTTSTFSYVVADPTTSAAAIIDPVLDYNPITREPSTHSARQLLDLVMLHGLKVQWILETHAHADHLSSAQWLKGELDGKPQVGIGAGIRQVQQTFKTRLSLAADFPVDGSQFDVLFNDGDKLAIGSIPIEVIATPGHTPDSVTYLIGDAAFVGDTIFAPRYGSARCDFPGGSARTLYDSMQRLLSLPAQTRIFLCHDYPPAGVAPQFLSDPLAQRQNVHLKDAVSVDDFVKMRESRDATLSAPKLLEPSLRANVRAGHLTDPFFDTKLVDAQGVTP